MSNTDLSRIVRCPTCGKSTRFEPSNQSRPFCSQRCKTQDIAQWAESGYRIPGKRMYDDREDQLDLPSEAPDYQI